MFQSGTCINDSAPDTETPYLNPQNFLQRLSQEESSVNTFCFLKNDKGNEIFEIPLDPVLQKQSLRPTNVADYSTSSGSFFQDINQPVPSFYGVDTKQSGFFDVIDQPEEMVVVDVDTDRNIGSDMNNLPNDKVVNIVRH